MSTNVVFIIFLIFFGAALLSTIALFTRQSLLVAYMVVGIILGPWGLQWVPTLNLVEDVGEIGIIFLLFLLGMHLPPQKLLHMFKKITWVALVSSIAFAALGFGVMLVFGFTVLESAMVGMAMMFSSTIIGLKLLPTTVLHHQHTGEVMISILLMEDLIAIAVLLIINSTKGGMQFYEVMIQLISLPALLLFAFAFERFVLLPLIKRFDRIREYMFLVAIGWCLGLAELAQLIDLSPEIGAFIAGVVLATNPIALFIAESLKPLRDFFLVLFFFAVGASFNIHVLPEIIWPVIALALLFIVAKPFIYSTLLRCSGETKPVAWEVGIRLGQSSEFSLLIVYLATSMALITPIVANIVQAMTILTFVISSYWVVLRYPTPVAISEKLRRD